MRPWSTGCVGRGATPARRGRRVLGARRSTEAGPPVRAIVPPSSPPTGWSLSLRGPRPRCATRSPSALARRAAWPRATCVALVLPSCPEYVIALRRGGQGRGRHRRGEPPALARRARRRARAWPGPDLVVTTADAAPTPTRRSTTLPSTPARDGPTALAGLPACPAARRRPLADDPDRPIAIVFTSGTTGTPKGAVFGGRQLDFITRVDTGGRWGDPAAPPPIARARRSPTSGPPPSWPATCMRGGTTHLMARWRAADALALDRSATAWPASAGIPTQIALMLRDPTLRRARPLAACRPS